MAMKKCKECGKEKSSKAAVCPHCGYKQKKTGCFTWVAAIGISVFMVPLLISGLNAPPGERNATSSPPRPKTPEEIREEKIQAQFSKWDSSHIDLVERVKESMHDPDSFEHVETRFKEQASSILVMMKFRGNNAFGAKRLQWIQAHYDPLTGELIHLFEPTDKPLFE